MTVLGTNISTPFTPFTLGLQGTNSVTNTFICTTDSANHTTWHFDAGATINIKKINGTAGGVNPPDEGFWYFVLVPDNAELNGNYTSAQVIVDLGVNAGPTFVDFPFTIPTSGVWRGVLTAGDSPTNALNVSGVNTGGTSNQWHYDADGNFARGGLAPVTGSGGDRVLTVFGARGTVDLSSSIEGQQRYGQTPTVSMNLTPSGSASFLNTFNVNLGVELSPYEGTSTVLRAVTPNASGAATSSSYQVNTLFSQSPRNYGLAATTHTSFVSTGTTDSSSTPLILRGSHGPVGISSSDRGWVALRTQTGYSSRSSGAVVTRDQTISIGSGISLQGTVSYDDASRINASKLFRRAWDGSHQVPYLTSTVLDAHGQILPNTAVTARVRRGGTATNENSQNLTTNGSGVINWNYTVGVTDEAYNRFKNGGDTSTLSVPQVNVFGAAPFPFVDGNRDYRGPYPSKAKDVQVEGRIFGSNEPNVTASNVFGVSSEITTPNIWTGDAGQAQDDANNAPLSPVNRFKNLGTGSPRVKPSSEIDEGNGSIVDPSRRILRDTAGRTVNTSPRIEIRYAAYNVTLGQEATSETDGQTQEDLTPPIGYPDHFVTVSPPGDPSVVSYAWAFATTAAQRSTFQQVTDTSSGFSGDSGLYGASFQSINYTAVDPNLTFTVSSSETVTHPDSTITITAEMRRILATNIRVPVIPDNPLTIYVDKRDPITGQLENVAQGLMTLVSGSSSQYEFQFTPNEPASYAATITGFINGSRPPDSGDISMFTGARNQSYDLIVDAIKADELDSAHHILPDEPFIITAYIIDDSNGVIVPIDSGTAEVALLRTRTSGVIETLDPNTGNWVLVAGQQGVIYSSMDETGGFPSKGFTLTDGQSNNIVCNVRCKVSGVAYTNGVFREVTGRAFQHGTDSSENVGVIVNVIDPETSETVQSHLRSGHAMQLFSVPRTSAGVDPNAPGYTTQWSIRRTGDSGTFDWTGTEWEVSGGEDPINLIPPTTDFGNGATALDISEAFIQEAIDDNAPWIIASALVTYDPGTVKERFVFESIQIPLFGTINSHDKYGFDPLSVVGFGSR